MGGEQTPVSMQVTYPILIGSFRQQRQPMRAVDSAVRLLRSQQLPEILSLRSFKRKEKCRTQLYDHPKKIPSSSDISSHQKILRVNGVCQRTKLSATCCWFTANAANTNTMRRRQTKRRVLSQVKTGSGVKHYYEPSLSVWLCSKASLTRSRSSFPGLKWGTCFPDKPTDSPVLGLRPIRGAR